MNERMPVPQLQEEKPKLTKAEALNQDLAKLNQNGKEIMELFEAAKLIATKYESQEKQGTLPEKDKALYQIAKNWVEQTKGEIEKMRQEFMEKFQSLKSINPKASFFSSASIADVSRMTA
ncbi:hypothetical protein HZA44_00090 [Candidatus Peregrinibacteria bacterium]|nr:hypothetical protein [Candidatus Peregrinibacteria bacterium]